MARSPVDDWSLTRTFAFLAAVFAIVIGSLLPFAAMAAVEPGRPIILCTAEGPQTIQNGGLDGPIKASPGAKCAACVMPLASALPPPAPFEPAPVIRPRPASRPTITHAAPPPPARAPPRPPSTAPPLN